MIDNFYLIQYGINKFQHRVISNMMTLKFLSLTVSLVLTTLSMAGESFSNNGLEITKPSTNEVRPGQNNLAVYIDQVKNLTSKTLSIVSVTSPIAEKVELHTMAVKNNIMKMEKIDKLTIPGKGSISLMKGNKNGYHIMLFNIDKEFTRNNFPMSVYLSNGKSVDFQVQVLERPSLNHEDH